MTYAGVINVDPLTSLQGLGAGLVESNGNGGFAGLALNNGQIPIGVNGSTPVGANLQAGTNGLSVTNGAGSIVIDVPTTADMKVNSVTATSGFIGPIKPSGDLLPAADNTYNIGSALRRWLNGFFSGVLNAVSAVIGTLQVSGATTTGTLHVTGLLTADAAIYNAGGALTTGGITCSNINNSGTLSSGAITSSGAFTNGTNAMTTGLS